MRPVRNFSATLAVMNTRKLRYVFTCPMCAKFFTTDEPGEPCCTGPSESRDDHEMVVMRLHRVDKIEVSPVMAEKRAAGQLIMPHMEKEILRDVDLIINN